MKTTSKKGLLAAALALALGCAGLVGCSSGSEGGSATSEEGTGAIVCESECAGASQDETTAWIEGTVYDVDAQAAIAEDLESQKNGQTLADPLVVYNPFGTNTQALYVYFNTDEAASISYTVSVSDEEAATIEDESFTADSIADFTREVDDGESATEHEFLVHGLIPNVENTVTITATYEDGTTGSYELVCQMCDLVSDEELQLAVEDGESDAELEDGLFATLGNDTEGIPAAKFYDNDGILRGEIPLIVSRAQRLVFEDDLMYFSISNSQLAAMNELGQIVQVYTINEDGNYRLHHDNITDGDGHLIALVSDLDSGTIEDLVMFIDQESGEIDQILDLGDLFGTLKEESIEYHYENVDEETASEEDGVDWLHTNSLCWTDDDALLISCRQNSSIIKISNVYEDPTVDYIISAESFWEGTEYEDLVFEKVGDFLIQGGQHSIQYSTDDSLEDGQYYLSMYNNNVGISTDYVNEIDYEAEGLTHIEDTSDEEGVYSYYYKYLVDENAGTFELVDSFEVPYSGYNSSSQEYGDNIVIDSGMIGVIGEYDSEGELIRQYTMEIQTLLYRVYKYDL